MRSVWERETIERTVAWVRLQASCLISQQFSQSTWVERLFRL
jgi:hypothetical protein